MSEKRLRFTMESDTLYSCIFDNGEELTCFELVDLLNTQQSTIEQLQDLCGQSDGENAKLRIKNKEQQATITNLKGDIERQKYIIDELRKDNYKKFKKIKELKDG